jgi:hypothetical protein
MLEALDKRRTELLKELKALDAAREAFVRSLADTKPAKGSPTMSAAHRRKLSLAAKKRWAERKKKG